MNSGVRSPDRREGPVTADLAQIHTPAQLAAALKELCRRRDLSLAQVRDAADTLRRRAGWAQPLPRSTVSDILNGKRVPSKDQLRTLLHICSVPSADLPQWLVAWERALTVDMVKPPNGVRIREARPRLLGVHASIQIDPVATDLPVYVPRDLDADLRTKITAAADQGGFVLLVGGSSVGKTRSAFEAVTALLPDWWLVHPADPAEVAVLAAAPSPRTVVWLDELQRYLDGEHGLTGGLVRALLTAPHPVVIIGTLWPDRYTTYATLPYPGADPYAREREVLDLAAVIRIGPEFSAAEQDQARAAAARDPRLRVALEVTEYGLTQTLAAAPQLVARWEDAKTASPYGWAVLTAAVDMARLGARAPLSANFLRAAAPGYCTSRQQAAAPDNWFKQAMAYATAKLHAAAAPLSPAGTGIMGQVAGYTAADYLIQHASRERRYARAPASAWEAVLSHLRDPADITRLADSARNRLLYGYASPLYRHAADTGDGYAARRLAELLAEHGNLDGATKILRARADAGDRTAAWYLTGLLAERGDLNEAEQILRALADTGDEAAASLLAGRDLDGLRARADADDGAAASILVMLPAEHSDLEGLRARANVGDSVAEVQLARLLALRGDDDGLARRLAAWRIAESLAERGDLDGLRARADVGDSTAATELAGLLAERGDMDGLRARVDAGDGAAAQRLFDLLIKQGRAEEAERLRRFGLNPDGSIA